MPNNLENYLPSTSIHLLFAEYPFNTNPGTRKIQFDYGFITEESYRLGRIKGLFVSGQGSLAAYQYAGLDRTVKLTYVIPEINFSTISAGGDAGDPYTGWDRFGRTQDLRWSKGETLLDQTRYGYNRSSQRTWREAPLATNGNEDEAYQYDGLYQITGRQRGDLNTNHTAIGGIPVRAESFDYDPIGNCPRSAHALPSADSSSGIRASEMPAASRQWQQYQVSTDGTHDDDKTRVHPCFHSSSSSPPVFHFSLLTDHSALPPTLARTYDWGIRYRDDLIRRIKHLHDDATHYALHDYYNVTAIVGCTGGSSSSSESHADASIAVLERYGYSAFGDVRFMTAAYVTKPASDHAWDLLYKAQFRDIETGFYNYGFRYYSPMLGRWLSRDPIGEKGGVNLYGFVLNNGLNGTDFLGLEVVSNKRSCTWTFMLGHGSAQDLTLVDTESEQIKRAPEIRRVAKWAQGMNVPKLECGDRIGFQGCHRQNMNDFLAKTFTERHMLTAINRDDNRKMFDVRDGKRDLRAEELERGAAFHPDTRSRIDQMIQGAKDECKSKSTCCKSIELCIQTEDEDIKKRIFNNLEHYRIGEDYIHSDVVKHGSFYEYVRNKKQCIEIQCPELP